MRALAEFIVKKRILFFILFAAAVVCCVFCIPKVQVEYDISTYLPENTDTKKALDIMADEFVTYGTATVLVKDVPYEAAVELSEKIAALDGIKNFDFGEADYKDGCAKFAITFDGKNSDDRARSAYDSAVKLLDGSGYAYSVPVPLVNNYADVLADEMVVIIVIAAAVILLVLLFTSKSFAEILAFPVVFVVAAVLNMGTNFWLGKISFVSNTVCIILQLALAIDYAIILCHRFTEEKDKTPKDAEGALISALSKAIPEIASSSLTTISGLVALMFMQLGLGFDLGMVLAKSIVCSLLTVFFLMPGLLLLLSKLMDRSRHRNFVPRLRFWGRGVIKARYVLMPIFVALFAFGAVFSQKIDYVYSTESIDTSDPTDTVVAQRECEAIFGTDNMFAVLLPKGDYEKEREVMRLVEEEGKTDDGNLVTSSLGLAGIEYNGVYLTDSVDAQTFSAMTGFDALSSMTLFAGYALSHGEQWSFSYKIPLLDLFEYIISVQDTLPIDQSTREMLASLGATLDYAKSQLEGEKYTRLVFNLDASVESPEAFGFIERVTPKVKQVCPDAIFAGKTMSAYDLNQSFKSDNILITLLTVSFIYIILAFTFRSWGIPLVLVLVIQGAIFLNFSIPVMIGNNLFFFTYLIVSSIQMGATIDYAILLTNRFRQLKAHTPKREAMIDAVSGAFPTVFTSGTIMCVAGFLVGGLTTDPLIASMGTYLGTGTLISIAFVLTVLPAMLYTFDGILEKTVIKPRHPMKKFHMPNPGKPLWMQ